MLASIVHPSLINPNLTISFFSSCVDNQKLPEHGRITSLSLRSLYLTGRLDSHHVRRRPQAHQAEHLVAVVHDR